MADEIEKKVEEVANDHSRRSFVRTAAQVAVTAPAVGILLSASTKPASATDLYTATNSHILDDYTTGNEEEDIDALGLGSNTNIYGGANQDDHV